MRTGAQADTATQTDIFIHFGFFHLWAVWIIAGNKGHGFDRAGSYAFSTTVAGAFIDFGEEVGGMDGIEHAKFTGGDHGFTAAATTITDEVDALANVFTELDQIPFVGFLKQIHTFADIHKSGVAMTSECCGGVVEGHADIHGGITVASDVLHFMPAIAYTNAAMSGGLDDFAGTFIVKDV
jgi:hypothetical protein